jgi:hypothetical protein
MTSSSDAKWPLFNCFFSRVGLRTYQQPCTYSILYNLSWQSFTGKFVVLVCKEEEISNTFGGGEFKGKCRRVHETKWRTCRVHSLPRWKVVVRCVTRTRGCIYSCHTPDDGCKKRPKHVELSRSEIKVTTQLHRVGLFSNDKWCTVPWT